MSPDDFVRLANAFPEACLLVRRTGEIVAANRAAGDALHVAPCALTARSLHDLAVEPPGRVNDLLAAFARSGAMLPSRLVLRDGGGAPAPFRCEGAALPPRPPEPAVLVLRLRPHLAASERFLQLNQRVDALSREVHERRRAEAALQDQAAQLEELASELEQTIEELQQQTEEAQSARRLAEQASEAKSEFLATMSHELRTPLNAIIGYAELLEMGVGGPPGETQRLHLARIHRNARHLLQLIDEVLTFARGEAGREPVRLDEAELVRLSREAAEMVEPVAAARGLAIRLVARRPSVTARTDASKVRQILLNLLSNAVKFTERGEIVLAVDTAGPWALLSVHDTGIGIAPEDRTRIFDPFTQVDSSHTRRAGGTGLGLSVSRQLAVLLRGDLALDSVPGKGSTFTLRLPLDHPPS